MSLDAQPSKLTKFGSVVVKPPPQNFVYDASSISELGVVQIEVIGFEAANCSCRDVAVLACLWAIGELQREVMRAVQEPGAGAIGVD